VEEGREMSERAVPPPPSSLLVKLPASCSSDDGGEDRRRWVRLGAVDGEPPVSPRGGRRGGRRDSVGFYIHSRVVCVLDFFKRMRLIGKDRKTC
jgi:hypothetical protein